MGAYKSPYRSAYKSAYSTSLGEVHLAASADAAAAVARLSFTTDAQQVIERNALYNLVYDQSVAGNWSYLHEASFFTFTNTANALIGIKGYSNAANRGAPTHSATGVTVGTTSGLNLQYGFSEIGATRRGFMFGAYMSDGVGTGGSVSVMGAQNGSFLASQFSYKGDAGTFPSGDAWQTQIQGNIFQETNRHYGTLDTGLDDVLCLSGTSSATATEPVTFYRGRMANKEAMDGAISAANATDIWVNGYNFNGTVTTPFSSAKYQMAFTAREGFNFSFWRKGVLQFLRAIGAQPEAGRLRAVVFGDSISDSGWQANVWHDWLGTNSILDGTTYCLSGTGLGTNGAEPPIETDPLISTSVTTWAATFNNPTANAIIVMGGANDCEAIRLGGNAATITAAALTAIDTIIAQAKLRGVATYFVKILGFSKAIDDFDSASSNNARVTINAYMDTAAAANPGVYVLDIFPAIQGADVSGYDSIDPIYRDSGTDPIHPNQAGQELMGQLAVSLLAADGSLVGGTGAPS